MVVTIKKLNQVDFVCPCCHETMSLCDEEDQTFSCNVQECPIAIIKVTFEEDIQIAAS